MTAAQLGFVACVVLYGIVILYAWLAFRRGKGF